MRSAAEDALEGETRGTSGCTNAGGLKGMQACVGIRRQQYGNGKKKVGSKNLGSGEELDLEEMLGLRMFMHNAHESQCRAGVSPPPPSLGATSHTSGSIYSRQQCHYTT